MKPGFIPSPEERKMQAIRRNLQQMGYAREVLPIPEKPDERKDIKVEETPFPGEFTPLRIQGKRGT